MPFRQYLIILQNTRMYTYATYILMDYDYKGLRCSSSVLFLSMLLQSLLFHVRSSKQRVSTTKVKLCVNMYIWILICLFLDIGTIVLCFRSIIFFILTTQRCDRKLKYFSNSDIVQWKMNRKLILQMITQKIIFSFVLQDRQNTANVNSRYCLKMLTFGGVCVFRQVRRFYGLSLQCLQQLSFLYCLLEI